MVTIGYWKIRGLAAPLRMTCSYAGAEYTSVDYELQPKDGGGWDRSEWTSVKPGLMEKNAMMNLPYVLDGDVYIVQVLSAPPTAIPPALRAPCRRMPSPTAAAIAARAVQRVPRPPGPQVRAVWIECCRDSRGRAGAVRGDGPAQCDGDARVRRRMGCRPCQAPVEDGAPPRGPRRAGAPRAVSAGEGRGLCGARDAPPPRAQVPTSYTKLENFMKQQGKAYLVSDGPTVADFHMWEMMDQHERMAAKTGAPSPLGNFGTLRELYERIRAEPRLAGYFGSAAYALPQNNKSAAYGNTVDDGR